MLCAIWYQTLKNGIRMVGQNTILTSQNVFGQISQESVSLNPFEWHSGSYLTYNHLQGMYIMLDWHAKGISGENSNCSIQKVL